jgi:hypothetical protein
MPGLPASPGLFRSSGGKLLIQELRVQGAEALSEEKGR